MTGKNKQLRYRLYFWLMDACLVGTLFVAAEHIFTRLTGGFAWEVYPTWYFAVGLFMLFLSFGLAPFLILARFIRDEYAELLWKRTATIVVCIVAIAPYAFYLGAWAAHFVFGTADFFPFDAELTDTRFHSALFRVGSLILGTFVVVFQFLRWRDSR